MSYRPDYSWPRSSVEVLIYSIVSTLLRAVGFVVLVFFPSVLILYRERSDSGWLWMSLFGQAIGLMVAGAYLFFSPHHLVGLIIGVLSTAVWIGVMMAVAQGQPSTHDWYTYSDLPMGDWVKPVPPAQPKEMDTLESTLDPWK